MTDPKLLTDVANIIERGRMDRSVPSAVLAQQVIDTIALPRDTQSPPKVAGKTRVPKPPKAKPPASEAPAAEPTVAGHGAQPPQGEGVGVQQ